MLKVSCDFRVHKFFILSVFLSFSSPVGAMDEDHFDSPQSVDRKGKSLRTSRSHLPQAVQKLEALLEKKGGLSSLAQGALNKILFDPANPPFAQESQLTLFQEVSDNLSKRMFNLVDPALSLQLKIALGIIGMTPFELGCWAIKESCEYQDGNAFSKILYLPGVDMGVVLLEREIPKIMEEIKSLKGQMRKDEERRKVIETRVQNLQDTKPEACDMLSRLLEETHSSMSTYNQLFNDVKKIQDFVDGGISYLFAASKLNHEGAQRVVAKLTDLRKDRTLDEKIKAYKRMSEFQNPYAASYLAKELLRDTSDPELLAEKIQDAVTQCLKLELSEKHKRKIRYSLWEKISSLILSKQLSPKEILDFFGNSEKRDLIQNIGENAEANIDDFVNSFKKTSQKALEPYEILEQLYECFKNPALMSAWGSAIVSGAKIEDANKKELIEKKISELESKKDTESVQALQTIEAVALSLEKTSYFQDKMPSERMNKLLELIKKGNEEAGRLLVRAFTAVLRRGMKDLDLTEWRDKNLIMYFGMENKNPKEVLKDLSSEAIEAGNIEAMDALYDYIKETDCLAKVKIAEDFRRWSLIRLLGKFHDERDFESRG